MIFVIISLGTGNCFFKALLKENLNLSQESYNKRDFRFNENIFGPKNTKNRKIN